MPYLDSQSTFFGKIIVILKKKTYIAFMGPARARAHKAVIAVLFEVPFVRRVWLIDSPIYIIAIYNLQYGF